MKIVGCDLHARQQTIAMVDTETGEFTDFLGSPRHFPSPQFWVCSEGKEKAAQRSGAMRLAR
jgi:hypothetical protein